MSEFNLMQLDAHNKYRNDHGVLPLAYDDNLAIEAQIYAETL